MARPIFVESWIRSATTFIVFCVCSTLCHGQYATFELLNNAYDDAIFVGESNIVLRCCVTDNDQAMIRIEPPNGSLLMNNGQSNCLDYPIPQVHGVDGGEYKCTLHYTCMDGKEMSNDLRLYINVPSIDEFPKCTRNGTHGTPYEVGDWLVMSCLCRQGDRCLWTSTVPGSHDAELLDDATVISHTGTDVVQIMVTNGTLLDTHRFDCFYAPFGQTTQICSIGPIDESANDTTVSTSVLKPDKCPEPMTTDGISQGTSQPNTTPKPEAKPSEGFIIVIIAVGIVAILLLVTVIALVVVCSRRRRNDSVDDDSTKGYKNYAYSTDADADKSPYYNQVGTTQDTISNIDPASKNLISSNGTSDGNAATGHTYDSPPLRMLESTKEESPSTDGSLDGYAEIGTSLAGRQSSAAYSAVVRDSEPNIPTEELDDEGGDFGFLYAKVNKKKDKDIS